MKVFILEKHFRLIKEVQKSALNKFKKGVSYYGEAP